MDSRRYFISPRFTKERERERDVGREGEINRDGKYRYNERPIGFLRFLRGVSCPFLAATLEYRINARRLIARKRQDLSFSISLYSSVSKWTTSGQGRGGEGGARRRGKGGGNSFSSP